MHLFWLFLIIVWLPFELFRLVFLRCIGTKLVLTSKIMNYLNTKFTKSYRDSLMSTYIVSYLKERKQYNDKKTK